MSAIRGPGPGPNIRINGEQITTRPTGPISQTPATKTPVTGGQNSAQAQEQMFDQANQMSLRGEMAAQAISGNKRAKQKKDVKKKEKGHGILGDNKRIDGVFPDGDPNNKQEQAFQQAAEFEEKVLDSDLTFKRKAGQVQVGDEVFRIDLDDGKGALVAGDAAEITTEFSIDVDIDIDNEITGVHTRGTSNITTDDTVTKGRVVVAPPQASMPAEPIVVAPSLRNISDDTIPNVEIPTSETGLRRMLGLKTKAK